MSRILPAVQLRTFLLYLILLSGISGTAFSQTNYALSMNGTSTSYADLGTVAPTGNFSTGMTIECWVKWGAFNSWSRLLDLGNGSNSDNILLANQGSGNDFILQVYHGATISGGISGPSNLVTGKWYHIAVTLDAGGNANMYIDGVPAASGNIGLPYNVARTKCYIGKSNWTVDGYLNASVDEFRIWNIARTQAEIKQDMFKSISPTTSGLVAYYHCDENGGTTLANSVSGAGAGNGTVLGGLTWAASPIDYSPNALNFDGTNDYVSIGSPLSSSSSYTKEAWVYLTTNSGPHNILSSQESPFWINGNFLEASNNFAGGGTVIADPGAFPINSWVHVAVTYDAGTGAFKLYRNGTEVVNGSTVSGYVAENNYVGAYYNTSGGIQSLFSGSIDEVRLWNVVRTQAQIQADMNHEIDPASADASGLVAYYTFNQNIAAGTNTGVVTIIDQKGTNNGTLTNFALSGGSSNFITQSSGLSALPVLFAHFSAYARGTGVQLDWSTAQEQNSASFTVQRSSDGRTWKDLATLAAAGQSNQPRSYRYFDATPLGGANYYRLLQRDADNAQMYSPVQIVTMEKTLPAFSLQNTVVTSGSLWLQVNRPIPIGLFNLEGKMIWAKTLGAGLQSVDLGHLPNGIYLVRSGSLLQKILVQ